MKRLSVKKDYRILAFLGPVIGLLIFMLIRRFAPFGQNSLLYSDMYHQYYPFFVSFRRTLLSGQSLLYNWDIGMGMDYLGLISYYLASPLNLLSVLVPESCLLGFFSLLVPIKLGLAGLFFAIFLGKLFHKNDLATALFGCFYALCAWALGYSWNIMWLDTFALLPLVALGTVCLLRDKKFILYTVTLFLSIFANYYIGLFTCIFVLLVFICYQICRCRSFDGFMRDLLRIALFSFLAIGMTAILELPALSALQTTYSSSNTFPTEFSLNIADRNTWLGLFDAMRQVAGNMSGGLVPTFKEGLPNLYCGIGTIIFSFLFLTSKQVKRRDRICCGVLLIFFSLSFVIRKLDFIWHGFHFPNMIPYRFSFLFSFVMLYMAYRAYLLRRNIRLWQIIIAGTLAVGCVLCRADLTDPVYLAYNGIFLLLYISTTVFSFVRSKFDMSATREDKQSYFEERKYRRRIGGIILLGVMTVELVLNIVNFGVNYIGTNTKNYPQGTEHTASMIRYMNERESELFYRTEMTHAQTLNDGALNGYHGISTFTSSANVNVTTFMDALGYGARNSYNRYCFEESSPVANLFLNLKYMIDRNGKDKSSAYFSELHSYGNVRLLENTAYLPLGFLVNPQIVNTDFTNANAFILQNDLIRCATGINENVWNLLSGQNTSIAPKQVVITSRTQTGYCSYETPADSDGIIVYTYTIDKAGFLCIDLHLSGRNSFTVSKNGVELYTETYSVQQMLAVGDVRPGDTVEIQLNCKSGETGSMRIRAGLLDNVQFSRAYDILSASTLKLTDFQGTLIEGTIDCNRDGILYTSIPQDGNWCAYVDGKPAPTVAVGGAMVGVLITQGQHAVQFVYQNNAFSIGWKISLACFVIFGVLCLHSYRKAPAKQPGRYKKR